MTTRNRLLAGLAVLIVLGAALVLAMMQRVIDWPETVQPLTVEEIHSLHVEGAALVRSAQPRTAQALNARQNPPSDEGQFVAAPTNAQRLQRFCPDGCLESEASIDGAAFRIAGATALYELLPVNKIQLVPANIAMKYLFAGQFDKARPYLREAVREHYVEVLRLHLCGQLAWLEDDPGWRPRSLKIRYRIVQTQIPTAQHMGR